MHCNHVVYPNCSGELFVDSIVLKRTGTGTGQQGHIEGLNELLSYFKTVNSEYYLILDSDCFPIHKDWCNKLINTEKDVAAIIRYENLDCFAHPSAFFFKRSVLNKLEFSFQDCTNIIGYNFKEVTSNIQDFFPLIRTNYYNPHPIMFGVYWNIFYHHGAGSRRRLLFRGSKYHNTFNKIELNKLNKLNKENFQKLITNTDEYIRSLNILDKYSIEEIKKEKVIKLFL